MPVSNHEGLENRIIDGARNGLICMPHSSSIRCSFEKYLKWLNQRGIAISREINRKLNRFMHEYSGVEYRIFGFN